MFGTHSHLLSSWLQVGGGTERAVLTSVKALHHDKENEEARAEEASSPLLVVIRSLYDANHM